MHKHKVQIAASILSADFGELNKDIKSVEDKVDLLHVDVMDGHFVPNLTFGAPVVKCIKTKLPMICHLMVENPEDLIDDFAAAGAGGISFHQEVAPHMNRLVERIKSLRMKAGVAINPATPVWTLEDIVDELDFVLVMSVNPGFGGQEFIPEALEKVALLREMSPDLSIEVDGGVNEKTAAKIIEAGANILVSGSYIFSSKNRADAIKNLRG
ncbi:ribulose-phosphate 3-epimerase [Patescibacteria group bacterium]|nr:ribulose-phosphate 3-epimerase [Patescibacteria group bacterium]